MTDEERIRIAEDRANIAYLAGDVHEANRWAEIARAEMVAYLQRRCEC